MQNEFVYNFDYKKKTYNNIRLSVSVLTILTIYLSALLIFIKPIKTSNYEFYFVEANAFSTYYQANKLAQDIQNLNGAGYIHLDKQYHVLLNFYHSESDAEKVVNNVKENYKNAKIYKISQKTYKNVKNLSKNQNKSIKNLSNQTINTIKNLSNLSLQLDKNEINFKQISSCIKNFYNEFKKKFDDFFIQFKTNSKHNISKEYVNNIKTDLEHLSHFEEQELKTSFKYLTIDIIVNYCSFLSSF